MKVSMFMGSTYFYVEVCTTLFWYFFVWNFLRALTHFTLSTPLVTHPCTPISLTSHLSTISGCPVLNHMYTPSPYISVGSALCQKIRFYTAAVILLQLLKSSSLKPQPLISRSAFVKYFILLIFFGSIRLLYLSGMDDLAGFMLSEFGTSRHCSCYFMTLSYLIPIQ